MSLKHIQDLLVSVSFCPRHSGVMHCLGWMADMGYLLVLVPTSAPSLSNLFPQSSQNNP